MEPALSKEAPTPKDAEAPVKKWKKAAHTCQGDAAAELAALKDEICTLHSSIKELATGLQGVWTTQKDHWLLITDLKEHFDPLLKLNTQVKALEVVDRDVQAAIGEVSTATNEIHTSLVEEVRPILISFNKFMGEARPVINTLSAFMVEARPRINQLITGFQKTDESVTETVSRLSNIEGRIAVAGVPAKRPRLALDLYEAIPPLPLLPHTATAMPTHLQTAAHTPPYYSMSPSTPASGPYSQPQILPSWGAPATGQALILADVQGGQGGPTVQGRALAGVQGGQGGARAWWGVKFGPVNLNGASARDVLRALFNPIQGGSTVTRALWDPVLIDNMDHILAKAPSKQEAFEFANFWNNRRSPQHASVNAWAHPLSQGN
ncbi:hypothetical protein EST38_g10704 [Candolleomyces aberdarensis]|uniref:Uncharacterized protein n=1 Tax=Candolleomyces aberdarensis TaxID=2316362 RepID=A0A4Q2D7F4_9AGAR|nr:hypothetical protein EST38_g10704 [Candolleomyces aberdarensis]